MRPPLVDRDGPWFRSLDGAGGSSLVGAPDAAPDGFAVADFDDAAWTEVDVPGCWTMQGFDRPIYTNVAMPFRTFPPDVPDDNPTGCYRTSFTVPDEWRDRRVVLHIGGAESALRVWVNGAEVGIEQGLAPRGRVRRHRTRAPRREQRARGRGRALVRRVVPRGPGPVVARGHPPRGVPLQHAAHVPRRRARDRVARARPGTTGTLDRARRRRLRRGASAPTAGSVAARVENAARPRRDRRGAPRHGAAQPRRRTSSAGTPCACTPRSLTSRRGRPSPDALPAPGRAPRSRRQPARHRDVLDRVPPGRDPGPRVPRQRHARAVPRREPARLRSRHRARRDASSRCAPTSCS